MGWTQEAFEFAEPRYFFNALRGHYRAQAENARMVGFYASIIHASQPISIKNFGLFAWESLPVPKFAPVDPENLKRFNAL